MPDRARLQRLVRFAIGSLAVWIAIHAYSLSASLLYLGPMGPATELALLYVSRACFWAALWPCVIAIVERLPDAAHRVRRAGILLLTVLLVSLTESIVETALIRIPYSNTRQPFWTWVRQLTIHPGMLTATLAVVVAYGVVVRRQAAERQRRQLELEATVARLATEEIRERLRPADLQDVLHALAGAVETDPRKARRLLTAFAELLRLGMDLDARPRVPLQDELDFAERYAALRPRPISLRIEVEDDAALHALVPPRALQSFLAPVVAGAAREVTLRVRWEGDLALTATRDGAGGGVVGRIVCDPAAA